MCMWGIQNEYQGGEGMYTNIEAERARYKMTQEELSIKLGVSLKTLQNWISGKTAIPCTAVAKLADMWDVSTDYLLGLSVPNRIKHQDSA